MNTIGLGNALVDVLLRLKSDDVLSEIGIQKGAMDMIDEAQMIRIRASQEGLERSQAPGGSVCNTMRAMAKLGAQTGFIGKVGTDDVAAYYEEALKQVGVTPYFVRTKGISGSCTVLISPDGERTMGTFLGPAATLTPDEITTEMLSAYHTIYIEGYLLVNEALVRQTMKRARAMGLQVALDLSNFNIVNAFRGLLEELIPQYVNILFSNESEAEAFTGRPAHEALQELARLVDVAVVTVGKEGALVCGGGETVAVPASGGKPVDTTGAGDHFAAGFLYGRSQNATLEQSARIGSLLAGHVIGVVGAEIPADRWEGIRADVRAILAGKSI